MQPTVKFDRTLVTVLVDEVVHVLLELAAPPAAPMERAPLDVVVVLDRSGSMAGPPLAAVTAATAHLLRLAGSDDRIGVVAFDDTVDLVLPLDRHAPDAAAARVLGIDARGSTNLSGGWLKGLEMLTASPRSEALRRIVVLTDGHANAGITSPGELVPLVKAGHRQGVTTSCVGFDDGYDEGLLAALADAGMGNDYWCAGPDQAAQVFVDEFEGLASVVAQNVSVEITPTDVVAASAVLNEFPVTEVPDGLHVALGDAYGGEVRKVVAKFHLRPVGPGPIDVARLTVRWAATVGDVALHTLSVPVRVTAGDGSAADTGASADVTEEVLRLEVARVRREANDAADRGDYGRAHFLLSTSADQLRAYPSAATEVDELMADAARMRPETWSASDAKRNFSRSRGLSKGRRSTYSGQEPRPDSPPPGSTAETEPDPG
jgi:Ca-activated chloride channel family protein